MSPLTQPPASAKPPDNPKPQPVLPAPPSADDIGNLLHSKKKKKSSESVVNNETATEMDMIVDDSIADSYKEKLLNAFGDLSSDEEIWGEAEEELSENRWYKEEAMGGPPEIKPFNPKPVVPFTEDELASWSTPWRNTLIVKVLGKRVSLKQLDAKLHKEWAKDGAIKVTDMADGYFLVRLATQADYIHALFEGPWKIADHYLIVQRWRPLFSFSTSMTQKIAIWIRIPGLPLELCNDSYLKRIGSTIGTMLKIDKRTSLHDRGRYARICVEINLENQLPSHVIVGGEELVLEYEGLHAICFRCGKYGHKKDQCREFMGNDTATNQQNKAEPSVSVPKPNDHDIDKAEIVVYDNKSSPADVTKPRL